MLYAVSKRVNPISKDVNSISKMVAPVSNHSYPLFKGSAPVSKDLNPVSNQVATISNWSAAVSNRTFSISKIPYSVSADLYFVSADLASHSKPSCARRTDGDSSPGVESPYPLRRWMLKRKLLPAIVSDWPSGHARPSFAATECLFRGVGMSLRRSAPQREADFSDALLGTRRKAAPRRGMGAPH